MTDDDAVAKTSNLAARAWSEAEGDVSLAGAMLIEAACVMMIAHISQPNITLLAKAYGDYMLDRVRTSADADEVLQ